jgi:hypothetical protein
MEVARCFFTNGFKRWLSSTGLSLNSVIIIFFRQQ